MRAYLNTFFAALALGLAAVAALNALVDPFGILPSPTIEGINVPKTEADDRARLGKAHAVRWFEPTAVVLGASSSLIGLDPQHPGWKSERPYNLALPGGNIRDCRRHLEHALAIGPLDRVVLGLDLAMFNVHLQVTGDFDETRLLVTPGGEPAPGRPLEPLALLFSAETTRASVRTLRRNASAAPGTIAWPDGRLDVRREREWARHFGGTRGLFAVIEKGFLRDFYFPPPTRAFAFETDGHSSFEELEQILSLARRHEIDLHLLLSPTHVRLREVTYAAGLETQLEHWVRTVVGLAAASDTPLLDFSGYHPLTAEEVPPPGDGMMRWHFDTVHYRKELGDLVLDRLFGHEEPGREVPEGFGVRLTPGNVEARLEQMRLDQGPYRARHPAEVAEIRKWAREAEAGRGTSVEPSRR